MGFDGYFLNQEEGYYEDFKPFMAELTEAGLYTQWYDTNSYFNSSKAQWLEDDTNGRINDSVFVNYGWTGGVDSSISYAESIGVDPFERLFFGLECNQNKFSGSHSSARDIANLYDETGNPRASVALFTPSDWYQRGVDEIPAYDPNDTPVMQQDEYQWMVAERERMFFSGVMEDPTDTGLKAGYSAATDVGVEQCFRLGRRGRLYRRALRHRRHQVQHQLQHRPRYAVLCGRRRFPPTRPGPTSTSRTSCPPGSGGWTAPTTTSWK